METLGLSGPPARQDSFFRRIFWPSRDSVDADMLGQQGFWICLIVAVGSIVLSALQGHLVLGILYAFFYFFGGIGVREHDVLAAIAVTLVYLANIAAAVLISRQFPGFLTLFIAIILISNVRGCWIASEWLKAGDPDLIPLRMNETWQDKLVDQMPAHVWPRIRIAFYFIAAIALLLVLAGVIVVIVRGPAVVHSPPGAPPDAIVHVQ